MNKHKTTWYAFQGCVVAVGPLTVASLAAIAAYKLMQSLELPPFVTSMSAFCVFALVFQTLYMLKEKMK